MYKKKFIRTNKKDFFINYLKILHKIKKYRNFALHFYETMALAKAITQPIYTLLH